MAMLKKTNKKSALWTAQISMFLCEKLAQTALRNRSGITVWNTLLDFTIIISSIIIIMEESTLS